MLYTHAHEKILWNPKGFKQDKVQLIQVLKKINAGGAAHALYWHAQQQGRAVYALLLFS